MENITSLTGSHFKVHNTWDLYEDDKKDKLLNKIQDTLKKEIKTVITLDRVKSSYITITPECLWFCYETKKGILKVSLFKGSMINRGTWFTIADAKFVESK